MDKNECEHDVIEKYVTPHGLACKDCLTDDDFKRYPGWKERLAMSEKRAEVARQNFQHGFILVP